MIPGRRRILGVAGTLLGAGVAGALAGRLPSTAAATAPVSAAPLPWPYPRLDPDVVAARAYWDYFDGHCMYGVFAGIVGDLAEKCGGPFRTFPLELMKYGAGGVAGWGTLCGTLNGAAAAIHLVSADPEPVIDELFGWYSSETLPDFIPEESPKPLPRSVARSPLCHVSVAEWCKVSGLDAYSVERNERCARLAAATARHTVESLNLQQAGALPLTHPVPEEVQLCRSCHERGGQVANARGRMDCRACHREIGTDHLDTSAKAK
ncbi:MAG TPA: C-GCAxxG-C-C family protein [Deferrisomatales bacterium]|nr:C-GCAxxG-C-C family protein [Deferrisomatales bacterium]